MSSSSKRSLQNWDIWSRESTIKSRPEFSSSHRRFGPTIVLQKVHDEEFHARKMMMWRILHLLEKITCTKVTHPQKNSEVDLSSHTWYAYATNPSASNQYDCHTSNLWGWRLFLEEAYFPAIKTLLVNFLWGRSQSFHSKRATSKGPKSQRPCSLMTKIEKISLSLL